LAGELKELRRTVALETWGNRYAVKALEEISRAYREMLVELVDYALRYRASLKNLCTRAIPRARVPLTGLTLLHPRSDPCREGERGPEGEGYQDKAQASQAEQRLDPR